MAIKPILFNTEMVRAILEGRKSCTRRIVKPQQLIGMLPDKCKNGAPEEFLKEKKLMFKPYCDMTDIELINTAYKAPYQPGDLLYVRETWMDYAGLTMYKADCDIYRLDSLNFAGFGWKPSIHMPKEAARIWLKVTGVRVERLQEITEDGAEAEGMPDSLDYPVNKAYCPLCKGEGIIGTVDVHSLGHMDVDCPYCDSYRKRFENLWNSTIKKSDLDRYGWDANPWVWVIEFERCEKPQEVNDND